MSIKLAVAGLGFLSVGCGGGALQVDSQVKHFGDVYVGTSADLPLEVRETGGANLDLAGFPVTGSDASAFRVVAPTGAVRLPASGRVVLTLRFSPTEARQYRNAELDAQSFSMLSSTDFPVALRGNGVFQKEDIFFDIRPGDHPTGEPLEFGDVLLGGHADQIFAVFNASNQPLQATVSWVSPHPAFGLAAGSNTLAIGARSTGFVALRFAPTQVGPAWAVVELRSGTSMAGIVLHGTGVQPSLKVSGASFTPSSVDPGGSIEVQYTLQLPPGAPQVTSARLEGLPPNMPGGPSVSLPMSGSGAPVSQTVPIQAPAMDGIYPLSIRFSQAGAPDVVVPLGPLAVQDLPATISDLVIRDSSHSRRECELPLLQRTIEYRVRDPNGASDVYLARVDELQPPPGADGLLQLPPTVPLLMPANPNVIEDVVASPIDLRCKARAQTWNLILKWQEDDKTQSPPLQVERLRVPLPYQVKP